jgi:hypothetical protein
VIKCDVNATSGHAQPENNRFNGFSARQSFVFCLGFVFAEAVDFQCMLWVLLLGLCWTKEIFLHMI